MTQVIEGSTLGLVLSLVVLGTLIVLCSVLLAPHTCCRAIYRLAQRPRPAARHRALPRYGAG